MAHNGDNSWLNELRVGKPDGACPEITEDLMNVDVATFGAIYQRHQAWHSYVLQTLADVKCRCLTVSVARRRLEAELRLALKKKIERSNQDVEDRVVLDPKYQSLINEEIGLEQERVQIVAVLRRLEGERTMISRTVELRRQEIELCRTETSFSNRKVRLRNIR